MKLRLPDLNFKEESNREFIIQYITNVINPDPKNKDFKPYKPDHLNNDFWLVATDYKWKLFFREDCNNVIEILYRYESKSVKVEKILCKWLCFLLNAEIID